MATAQTGDVIGQTFGVTFDCPRCSHSEPGGPEDACIFSYGSVGAGINSMNAMSNKRYILLSAHDPTVMKISQKCDQCPLNYMTLVRSGVEEQVTVVCKCGYMTSVKNADIDVITKPP